MKPKSLYNEIYKVYKANDLTAEKRAMVEIVRQELPKGASILDIGCGAGNFAEMFRDEGFHVTGLDHAPQAVELTQSRGIEAILCDVDEEGLPFPDNSFDLVWLGDVLEHVLESAHLVPSRFIAVTRFPNPRRSREKLTESRWFGRHFGREFIVQARHNKNEYEACL